MADVSLGLDRRGSPHTDVSYTGSGKSSGKLRECQRRTRKLRAVSTHADGLENDLWMQVGRLLGRQTVL